MRHYLVFLPSLGFGLIGAIGLSIWPFPYERQLSWFNMGLLSLGLVGILYIVAHLLEAHLASFRYAMTLLEQALSIPLSHPLIISLALLTSLAEELFFRGLLLPSLGVWGQAVLFGLMHPAGLRGWSYSVFSFLAALLFGYSTLISGSLIPALLAHFVINLQGFLKLKRKALLKNR